MLATKVICPHCSKHLKTSKPLTVGHRVLCSRCGRSFPVRPEIVNGAAIRERHSAPHVETPLPPAPPHPHAEHGERVPDVIPPPHAAPAPKRQTLWIAIVFGGLLMMLGTTLGLVVYFATHENPQENPVQTSTETPSEPDTPRTQPSSSDNRHLLVTNRPEEAPSPRLSNDPPPSPKPEPIAWLPPAEQTQVNQAIERGVGWLKESQRRGGSWRGGTHSVGLTALPALTLLECGVKTDDQHIQKALKAVRKAVPGLTQTYELALVILFLDRLGDPDDEKLIRTCALRLVAGQSRTGGWTYTCHVLTAEQERDLLTVMEQRRPRSSLDLFVGGPGGSAPPGFLTQTPGTPLDKTIQGESIASKRLTPGSTAPLDEKAIEKGQGDVEAYKKALARLPAHLRELPALQPPQKSHKLPSHDISDNSNTQFAILGLSAANKHHLPLDRTLALIVQRFRTSAAHKGGWGYNYAAPTPDGHVTHTMTGAGLLGLAVGMGLAADHTQPQARRGLPADAAIEKGFNVLGEPISGKPVRAKESRRRNPVGLNFYLLWTIERCGVLFNRREFSGKEWYPWGVDLLLDHQTDRGSWQGGNYPGSLPVADTCFALLFLKRANLAKNLTEKLEFFMEGKKLQGPKYNAP